MKRPDLRLEAIVDLDAIVANARRMGERGTVMAVVKADGYGHGAVAVAGALRAAGVRRFAVATVDEAATVAPAVDGAPLLVFGPVTEAEALRAGEIDGVELVAWSSWLLDRFGGRVHVKVDTGMHRLGAAPADVPALVAAAGDRLAGVMTHFATADEGGDGAAFAREQARRFAAVVDPLRARLPAGAIVHAANSAAALALGPAERGDVIRPGLALYGLDPFGGDPADRGLVPAMRLVGRVGALRDVEAGESVGYGRTWTAPRRTRIAVVGCGYADGLRRGLSNRLAVRVGDHDGCPLVGTISMDLATVAVPDDVRLGDPVELLGPSAPAREWARHLGTIAYEVTCGIGPRVPRRHVGAPVLAAVGARA